MSEEKECANCAHLDAENQCQVCDAPVEECLEEEYAMWDNRTVPTRDGQ